MRWWLALLIGGGVGLLNSLILFGIINFFKKHGERKNVKKAIKNKNFLTPLDKRDYNYENWTDLIDLEKQERDLKELNKKIFKKREFIANESQIKAKE